LAQFEKPAIGWKTDPQLGRPNVHAMTCRRSSANWKLHVVCESKHCTSESLLKLSNSVAKYFGPRKMSLRIRRFGLDK
jgi:hypothetical protein